MDDTAVENPVCVKCGVGVRPDTQFCYNCGAPVQEVGTSDTKFVSEPAGEAPPLNGTKAKEILPGSLPRLQTAAAMRQRPKSSQRKAVEIVWEKPDGEPNSAFIAASVALLIFAVIVVLLALYLR